jgi:methylated-DNA-protein-cysteine methyltransferase-like protein
MEELDFFEKVYLVCRQVPYGKVTSYGAVAKAIGSPMASRMVGWALNKSSSLENPVPAHRILNRNGMLTGKKAFGDPNLMEELLSQEGHTIVNDTVIDFKESFWQPEILD